MPTKKPVTVVARIKARPGQETAVREMLHSLIAPTRTEAGCVSYHLHISPDDGGSFLFYENWIGREELEKHLRKPYLQDFLVQSEELLAEPIDLSFWDRVE